MNSGTIPSAYPKGYAAFYCMKYEVSEGQWVDFFNTLKDGQKGALKFSCVSSEGLTFVKTFTFKADSYGFDLAVAVTNHTKQSQDGQLNLDLSENYAGEEASRFHFLGFNGCINNKTEDILRVNFFLKFRFSYNII